MKKRTINIYEFDELSDEAKEVARQWWRDAACSDDWWEGTYSDAALIGIKITEFDIDQGNYIEFDLEDGSFETARAIIKNHGKVCDTYKLSANYLKESDALYDTRDAMHEDDSTEEQITTYEEDKIDEHRREYEGAIGEEYLTMLRGAYENYYSDEVVTENIVSNEYEFLEDGSRA